MTSVWSPVPARDFVANLFQLATEVVTTLYERVNQSVLQYHSDGMVRKPNSRTLYLNTTTTWSNRLIHVFFCFVLFFFFPRTGFSKKTFFTGMETRTPTHTQASLTISLLTKPAPWNKLCGRQWTRSTSVCQTTCSVLQLSNLCTHRTFHSRDRLTITHCGSKHVSSLRI